VLAATKVIYENRYSLASRNTLNYQFYWPSYNCFIKFYYNNLYKSSRFFIISRKFSV